MRVIERRCSPPSFVKSSGCRLKSSRRCSRLPWQGRIKAAHTIVRELRAAEQYAFKPERYKTFTTPTLLILGGDSPPLFKAAIDELHAGIPGSQIAVLPGQRHAAMDTGTALFTTEVIRFLSAR